jgi:Leucine-rich repeat (LRR) protein
MEPAPLQALRKLLANPSQASWRDLCQVYLTKPLFPQVYQEVTQRLGAWSDDLREVPVAWLLTPTLAKGAAPLLRALSLDAALWPEASLRSLLTAFTLLRRLSVENASTKELQALSQAKTALTHLTLSHSPLASIDDLHLSPEDPLLSLELSHHRLAELSLVSLPRSLQSLNLSHNQLSLWQEEDIALPMLQSLSLAHNLYQEPTSLEAFWRSRSFPMLREVDLSGLLHAAEPLYYHAKPSPLCQNLLSISLDQCGVTDEQVESLSRRSDSFSRLIALHLSENPITDDGLSLLGMSLIGKRLHSLSLSANEGVSGFELQPFQMLTSLQLKGDGASTYVSAEALRELPWNKLESLALPDLLLSDELFEVLEEVPFSLSSLELSNNKLSAKGLRRFLMRCNLSGLRRLSLAQNSLQNGVAFLAEYESTHHLEHLDLSQTQLEAGALSLIG